MRLRESLDIIADDRGAPMVQGDAAPEANPESAQQQAQDDSQSTSSSSTPPPVDNEESDFYLAANDSQSSLGVPNIEDMQVTDEECRIAPINRLPNELLIAIFVKLTTSSDILHVMLTCKSWARNAVEILWHRPACSSWERHTTICQTLSAPRPYFAYRHFIRRLNLSALAPELNDGSVESLEMCSRVERLTMTGCKRITDAGLLKLLQNNHGLLALDISGMEDITETSIYAVAEKCRRLQGLNVSNCTKVSVASLVELAQSCRFIKRLKLNECTQVTDEAVIAFAENCPNILEIDLHQCRLIGNDPVTALMSKGKALRELRLASCDLIDDSAFLSLPANKTYEQLRILDLTSCSRLTDRAVEKIIDVAPRLRNLVLAKCRNITDAAVFAIARLGKNLHYVHLGHCGNITDEAVKRLVQCCNRIRYIDLGCCVHLTDDSVVRLATLPKLKRIGLVKCSNITDESVYALARANQRRPRRDADGNLVPGDCYNSMHHSSLERVHLSYCTNLTLRSVLRLLNACPRLTHLSVTGVQAFLREDLESFCREAPAEFTEHQRAVFCVFSGQGVTNLRRYLNSEHNLTEPTRGARPIDGVPNRAGPVFPGAAVNPMQVTPPGHHAAAAAFIDDGEPDAVDDDDGLEDGSEMVIDTQPMLHNHHAVMGGTAFPIQGVASTEQLLPPPPPAIQPQQHLITNPFHFVPGQPFTPQGLQFYEALRATESSIVHGTPSQVPLVGQATGLDSTITEGNHHSGANRNSPGTSTAQNPDASQAMASNPMENVELAILTGARNPDASGSGGAPV
ncbi:hypothetical protein SMACR_03920 [Sordaria macrospora]|uniref:WGS project CABT00000000 data, contig 2.17 n=2 Tax=Sordaria macrospora TaxID=5147 RepID=F7W0B5_SORMK|nr:uncharacterized protein SMAC_03920 [Sordaria macrospora k-hell]KAA8634968.1 hypothetical protein SMACR_03920 [Sordaria macrospora]KAH7633252.1 hypothetical protein B0T09DRAFT_88694 [Sordaria sp. MPI-SDFR-AT-0083]WPJ60341.1 hypothetical protein SMAC4_03920 [Sordaria macrospora]CCC11215.1 unnamed protein product [Sordaria macrospora k-hell]